MYKISRAHLVNPILAVLIQEHHLTARKATEINTVLLAHKLGLLYIQADQPEGNARSGVAIVIPYSSIEKLNKNESDDQARQRIRDGAATTPDGRFISADLTVGGENIQLISMYAHDEHQLRPNFFKSNSNRIL